MSGPNFDPTTLERLTVVETNQENLEEKVDGLSEGQQEIIDRLDDIRQSHVTEDEFVEELEDVRETAEENESFIEKKTAIARAGLILCSGVAGASGYVLYLM